MRITLQQIHEGKDEVIIRYRQMTEHIEEIVKFVEGQGEKLVAIKDGQQFLISIHKIIYLESVDGVTYLYTEHEVYKTSLTLVLFEALYVEEGFFRCSKSMVINIYRIKKLKSMSGSRIDVTLDNDEHVVISRHYSKELRRIIREEA